MIYKEIRATQVKGGFFILEKESFVVCVLQEGMFSTA